MTLTTVLIGCPSNDTILVTVGGQPTELAIGKSDTQADTTTSTTLITGTLLLEVGDQVTLAAIADTIVVSPGASSDPVLWLSANSSVASVTSEGVVRAQAVGSTEVYASSGDASASVPVTVADPSVPPSSPPPGAEVSDRILADDGTGWSDTYALVTGLTAGGECRLDEYRAFRGLDLLENLTSHCAGSPGRVVVFSQKRAVGMANVTWSSAADEVDLTGLPTPFVVPVAVRVALARVRFDQVIDDSVSAGALSALATPAEQDEYVFHLANAQLETADTYFRKNRTGVGFDSALDDAAAVTHDETFIDSLEVMFQKGWPGACHALDDMSKGTAPYLADHLNVYFIAPDVPDLKALHCRFQSSTSGDRVENVILVNWDEYTGSTLAHELGHAMGLAFPYGGHTTDPSGLQATRAFPPDNMMTVGMSDTDTEPQSSLTLGQALRVSLEPDSWVNHAVREGSDLRDSSWPRLPCPCDPDSKAPCPTLYHPDPPPAAQTPGVLGACQDALRFSKADGSLPIGEVLVLLSGRRWRDQLCVQNLVVGPTTPPFGYVSHVNMDRSVGCEARITAFSELWGFTVREDPGQWTHRFNQFNPPEDPPLPLPLRVDLQVAVWTADAVDPEIASSWSSVDKTYFCGMSPCEDADPSPYWSGIRPKRDGHDVSDQTTLDALVAGVTPGCVPPVGAVPDRVNVYFVSPGGSAPFSAGGGYSCRSSGASNTGVVLIEKGAAPTELAHQIGRLFGLSPTSDPANVMSADATGSRVALTLGQVFRMHMHEDSWLADHLRSPPVSWTVLAIDCDASPACPDETWDGT